MQQRGRIAAFSDIVFDAGYASPVRTPRGRDIMAACGQLKSESVKERASAGWAPKTMTTCQAGPLFRIAVLGRISLAGRPFWPLPPPPLSLPLYCPPPSPRAWTFGQIPIVRALFLSTGARNHP